MSCPIDVYTVLKDHVPAIMQLLTNALPQYGMGLRTTKCLNTAVMTMYLLLGTKALDSTTQCDVSNVKGSRIGTTAVNASTPDEARALVESLRTILFKQPQLRQRRELHYVMITDGTMPHAQAEVAQAAPIYFPGHVFVIERNENRYFLYQSYINRYDLVQYIASKGGSAEVERSALDGLLGMLSDSVARPVWTPKCTEAWHALTGVSAAQFEGFSKEGAIMMCRTRVDVLACSSKLAELVKGALEAMSSRDKGDDGHVWGDIKAYDPPSVGVDLPGGAVPMTIGQMRVALTSLQKSLSPSHYEGGRQPSSGRRKAHVACSHIEDLPWNVAATGSPIRSP